MTVLRVLCLLLGLIFVDLAAFSYERGYARIRHRIADWWLEVERRESYVESPAFSFLSTLSNVVEIRSIRFFIERPFSFPWLMICASLSLWSSAVAALVEGVVSTSGSDPATTLLRIAATKQLIEIVGGMMLFFPILFVMVLMWTAIPDWTREVLEAVRSAIQSLAASPRSQVDSASAGGRPNRLQPDLPGRIHKPSRAFGLKMIVGALHRSLMLLAKAYFSIGFIFVWLLVPPTIFLWFGVLGFFTLAVIAPDLLKMSWIWIVVGPGVGVSSALLFLAAIQRLVNRFWLLSLPSRKRPTRRTLAALISMPAVASLLFFAPFAISSNPWVLAAVPLASDAERHAVSSVGTYVAYCNTIDLLVAYGLLLVVLRLLIHRLVWSPLRTVVIALRLAGVAYSRATLGTLGGAFLVLASGRVTEFLEALPKITENFEWITSIIK